MIDIVFKLRAPAFCFEDGKPPRLATEQTMLDMSAAADEIERLREAVDDEKGARLAIEKTNVWALRAQAAEERLAALSLQQGIGEPVVLKPLIDNGEGEPDREAGLSTGSPMPEKAIRCDDCPPFGYPTDKTRCAPCPLRAADERVADAMVAEEGTES